jgi:predicted permease
VIRIPGLRRAFRLPLRGAGAARDEVDEEFAFHLEMRARELEARGLSHEAARAEALRQFGDVEDARAYCAGEATRRDSAAGWRERLGDLRRDVVVAGRGLRRTPTFTAVAVVTLALGIGATTAVLGVADALLFRPLHFHRAERLVAITQRDVRDGTAADQISVGDFVDLRDASRDVFSEVALVMYYGAILADERGPETVSGRRASAALFPLLDVRPALGRLFLPEDEREGSDPVVVLSHELWTTRFGGDPAIVGRDVRLNGVPRRVVGVLPRGFQLPYPAAGAQLWVPFVPSAELLANRTFWGFWAVARLRDGADPVRARGVLDALAVRLEEAYPTSNTGRRFEVTPLAEKIAGERRAALLAVLGAAAFVLLIACANLANLLLTRNAARRRELAVRAALGAGRARLAGQLLVESALLAALGGALGVALARWGIATVRLFGWDELATLDALAPDASLLAVAAVVTVGTALLCGVAPALAASRARLGDALRDGGRGASGAGGRAAGALVAAEVALAFVLLCGAGLMIATLASALRLPPGFDARGLVTFHVSLPGIRYDSVHKARAFHDELTGAIATIPGVTAVSAVDALPLTGEGGTAQIVREDRPAAPGSVIPEVKYQQARPGYFRALGIPIVRGRDFEPRDVERRPHVSIISEATARAVFPGEDPIGKRIQFGVPDSADWHEVVGVVGDVRHRGLATAPERAGYELFGQHWSLRMSVVVRATVPPSALIPAVRARLRALDPEVPLHGVATMEERALESLAQRRFVLLLLAVFAALALLLAAVGIYGVAAQAVRQRRREIGIRMALGAAPSRIARRVVREGAAMALAGIGVGVAAALALTRLLAALLVGVTPTDWRVLALVALALLGTALLAGYVPARRAAMVDPAVTLREE